jgi:hypothetical protein
MQICLKWSLSLSFAAHSSCVVAKYLTAIDFAVPTAVTQKLRGTTFLTLFISFVTAQTKRKY